MAFILQVFLNVYRYPEDTRTSKAYHETLDSSSFTFYPQRRTYQDDIAIVDLKKLYKASIPCSK